MTHETVAKSRVYLDVQYIQNMGYTQCIPFQIFFPGDLRMYCPYTDKICLVNFRTGGYYFFQYKSTKVVTYS